MASDEHGADRKAVDLAGVLGRSAARPPEKRNAIGLDEAGGGKRRREREQRAHRGDHESQAPLRQPGADQDRLERQPFRDEAVQRRQRRNRRAADQERDRRARQTMDQAAELLHVALAGRAHDRARAEEQQALEQRMVEHVQQRGRHRQRRRKLHAVRPKRHRKAQADEDDPDILDRGIGEQPLEILLHQRVEHAENRSDAAETQRDQAPPPDRRAEQVEHDADEAVDRDLGHHAAHQRGDVARRGRMGERQPDVQRHQSCFRSGAGENKQKHQAGREGVGTARADCFEGVAAVRAREQAKGQQQSERAAGRHQKIHVAGADVLRMAMVRQHQRPGRQRHELPGDQKREGVVGQHDEIHSRKIGRVERQDPRLRLFMAAVAQRIEARQRAAEIGDEQEKRGERIEAKPCAGARQADLEAERLRRQAHPKVPERRGKAGKADQKACEIDRNEAPGPAAQHDARGRNAQQRRHAPQSNKGRHWRQPLFAGTLWG